MAVNINILNAGNITVNIGSSTPETIMTLSGGTRKSIRLMSSNITPEILLENNIIEENPDENSADDYVVVEPVISIQLAPNITTIDMSYFSQSLESFTAGEDFTTVEDDQFSYYEDLGSFSGPNVTTVGQYAFTGCTSLSSVYLPNATTVGEGAFNDCTSLTSLALPNVTSLGNFSGCSNLMRLEVNSVSGSNLLEFLMSGDLNNNCVIIFSDSMLSGQTAGVIGNELSQNPPEEEPEEQTMD
jgi:hypothetical protein